MGFSFILAWRATVSTALVYNYWRLCWQQSTLCGLWASQRHHISLASLTHAYAGLHRLATNTRERKSMDTQNSGTQKRTFLCTTVPIMISTTESAPINHISKFGYWLWPLSVQMPCHLQKTLSMAERKLSTLVLPNSNNPKTSRPGRTVSLGQYISGEQSSRTAWVKPDSPHKEQTMGIARHSTQL